MYYQWKEFLDKTQVWVKKHKYEALSATAGASHLTPRLFLAAPHNPPISHRVHRHEVTHTSKRGTSPGTYRGPIQRILTPN